MRSYRLPQHTGFDGLTLVEGDAPRPGHGQVLARMHAASLNVGDLSVATGKYMMSRLPPDPVPQSDGAGEVVERGPWHGAAALGASDAIRYRSVEDWHKAARELTGGRGMDYVIEVGGPGTLQRSRSRPAG